ncbi:hypothetical protein DL95DRAFT_391343, partial [Leptodontidium sp. 2 PMI_412]
MPLRQCLLFVLRTGLTSPIRAASCLETGKCILILWRGATWTWVDGYKRSRWQTFANPLELGAVLSENAAYDKFWER